MPTSSSAPSLTMRAVSGATVSLEGVWRSGCVSPTPVVAGGAIRESFTVSGTAITVNVQKYGNPTCVGAVAEIERIDLDARLGAESTASLAGEAVAVTRVDGTNLTAGEPFKQVFHVDDTRGADRLFHGVFPDDGGMVDPDGYPTVLFEDFLERQ